MLQPSPGNPHPPKQVCTVQVLQLRCLNDVHILLTTYDNDMLNQQTTICIWVTLSPSLAAKCSDTQRRAFRAALPLPMLGFGSSTASSTASGCRRRFFCRISSSGVSMYVFEEWRGGVYVCMYVCVWRGGGGTLSMTVLMGL